MQSIQFKRTNTTGAKPTPEQLQVGEIALNLKDHVIFTKDKEHKVVQVSVSPEKHSELDAKVDANKNELDQTIALNDQTINDKVDTIKTETDQVIASNHQEINTKVDKIKKETDSVIAKNKATAEEQLNAAKAELNETIENNHTEALTAVISLSDTINAKVDKIKETTDSTIASNHQEINTKVDTIKTETNRTIENNRVLAETQLEETYQHVTEVIEANKQDADTQISDLTAVVESNKTAIDKKVDAIKTATDEEIANLSSRIDAVDGSSDSKFIKIDTNTITEGHILSRTANYLDDESARDLNKFGAFRTNEMDGLGALTLNVPHSAGKVHGRGLTFDYGSNGSKVKTYGFDREGQLSYSHRMYHEGDKPTPEELGVYSREDVDSMITKRINLSCNVPNAYFKLATATIPQMGYSLFIKIYGGNGFNAQSPVQANIVEIVIRSGNGNPKGLTCVAYTKHFRAAFEVCTINTSGDEYDIYVRYGRYTDNVIVEYGTSSGVDLEIYNSPSWVEEKPANVVDGTIIQEFNTYNKWGTLEFSDNHPDRYDTIHLTTQTDATKRKCLRKFRSSSGSSIWHEVVLGNSYRLAHGLNDERTLYTIDIASSANYGSVIKGGEFVGHTANNHRIVCGNYGTFWRNDGARLYLMKTHSGDQYGGFDNYRPFSLDFATSDIWIHGNKLGANNNLYLAGNLYLNRAANSQSTFNFRNWGSDTRKQVLEVSDESGWHFYTQRATGGTGAIDFVVNGTVHANSGVKTTTVNVNRVSGEAVGLIRGEVAGGSWASWRTRAAGILVDCPQSTDSAHTIWKATHWGKYHIAALGVHVAGGDINNATVRMDLNNAVFSYAATGDFQAGRNGNFNDVYIRSDRRLKINKEEFTDSALDKVNSLKVYTYDKVKSLKDREVVGHEIGIIAQDLQEVLPEAVNETNIGDHDNPENILTISNSGVNALLVKAVQELSDENKSLKAINEQLIKRLEALESKLA